MLLLQIPEAGVGAVVIIVMIILSFIITVLILRWAFRIDTMVHYLKTQTDLLVALAKQSNVPMEEIYQALGKKIPKNYRSTEIPKS